MSEYVSCRVGVNRQRRINKGNERRVGLHGSHRWWCDEAVICQASVHSPVAVRVRQTVFLLFASNQFAKSANAGLGLTILRDLPSSVRDRGDSKLNHHLEQTGITLSMYLFSSMYPWLLLQLQIPTTPCYRNNAEKGS